MLPDVSRDQGLDRRAIIVIEVAAGDEVLGERPGLVERPRLERGDEPDLVDEAILEGQQPEEEVAFGGDGHAARTP